ncbi:MAG: hypothetical protein QOJ65_95 [Fimbriimonadaceae bacterium]|jgi:putative nucleotidyltransferase with HDIG domain|nr:hypothetical protein [Fimbriimonadaceae bacterium]
MSGASAKNELVDFCIDKALEDLPAMPGIIIRVLEETEKPEPSAAIIEAIISSDQAIAAKVLRIVNSAYYGVPGRISSLGQAVVILGTQQVRNLVLSAAAMSVLPAKVPGQHEALRSFWTHSYATATAAQLISRVKELTSVDAETVFVGGLLHDIGRLFLLTHFPEMYEDALTRAIQSGGGLEDYEALVFGARHNEIGAAIAERWELPAQLIEIIRDHEGPFRDGAPLPILVVHAADAMAKTLFGSGAALLNFDIDPVAQEWLGFAPADYQSLRDEAIERVEEATGTYGLLSAA